MKTLSEEVKEVFDKGIRTQTDDDTTVAVANDGSAVNIHHYNCKKGNYVIINTRKIKVSQDEDNNKITHEVKFDQCIELSATTFTLLCAAIVRLFPELMEKEKDNTNDLAADKVVEK